MEIEETTWLFLGVTAGLVAYTAFAVAFYRVLHDRDAALLWLRRRRGRAGAGRTEQLWFYGAIPALDVAAAAVIAVIGGLVMAGREYEDIYAIAAATVAAVRIMAYFWEEPASELAKMVPTALLAVTVFAGADVRVGEWRDGLVEAGFENGFTYMMALVVLEWALRFGHSRLHRAGRAVAVTTKGRDPGEVDH